MLPYMYLAKRESVLVRDSLAWFLSAWRILCVILNLRQVFVWAETEG